MTDSEWDALADWEKKFFTDARARRRAGETLPEFKAMLEGYDGYLKGPLWKKIRRRVLKRDRKTCQRCGATGAAIVHHKSYAQDVMNGLNDLQLATVCDGCHNIIEFRDDGTRRNAEEKEAILQEKNCSTNIPEPAKIDLRTRKMPLPQEWVRMTLVQKRLYWTQFLELRRKKAEARRGKHPRKPSGE